MRYYSTNQQARVSSVRDAVLQGLAPDGGLFMPESLPKLPAGFLDTTESRSFNEIAYTISVPFLLPDVSPQQAQNVVESAFDFPIPLTALEEHAQVLELYHGPTLAFKDFGARFMARLMSYLTRHSDKKVTILVATSGDTGSAVAHGFYQVEGIEVVLLYPSGKVSEIQEKQFTTLGKNIRTLEVDGVFDDCQKLVKTAFLDPELQARLNLGSANSINIARLIPQSFYYVYAAMVRRSSRKIVFSVPSGNFGNLTAGLFAKHMGLSNARFVAATNANRTVPDYLEGQEYRERPSVPTLSNAMDVGAPSNFARMLRLYQDNRETMAKDVWGTSVSDDDTLRTMQQVHQQYSYVLDPHGAVGWHGLARYQEEDPDCDGIVLETAHPAKFHEVNAQADIGDVEIPEALQSALEKEKQSIPMPNDFGSFKDYLLS
jgi:threonine synthase